MLVFHLAALAVPILACRDEGEKKDESESQFSGYSACDLDELDIEWCYYVQSRHPNLQFYCNYATTVKKYLLYEIVNSCDSNCKSLRKDVENFTTFEIKDLRNIAVRLNINRGIPELRKSTLDSVLKALMVTPSMKVGFGCGFSMDKKKFKCIFK